MCLLLRGSTSSAIDDDLHRVTRVFRSLQAIVLFRGIAVQCLSMLAMATCVGSTNDGGSTETCHRRHMQSSPG